jgi:hypothetical protein
MHLTLSHILFFFFFFFFFISLELLGLLVAMQIDFAVTYPTGNLKSVFLVFFPRLLKLSPVFLRDLSWDPCSSMCSLTTYVTLLPTLSVYSLLMTSTFSEPLIQLRTAIYFSLTLTLYNVGALLTL